MTGKAEVDRKRLIGRKPLHSGCPFLFVTPPMCGLDIVRMIVSPRSARSFRILMVGHDVVVIGELFVAARTYPALLSDLAVEQFAHLRR
jgi:hypothetical protein